MNILFVAHEGAENFNGASRSLLGLITRLVDKHNISVVIPKSGGMLEKELKAINCRVYVIEYHWWTVQKSKMLIKWLKSLLFWKFIYCFKNKKAIYKISKIIKDDKIDIVHSNSSVINVGAESAYRCKVPHVWHLREFQQEDFNMHNLCRYKYFVRSYKEHANAAIAISKAIKNKFSSMIPSDKIRVIYNGIDLYPHIEKKSDSDDKFKVLLTGRISEAKGTDIAVAALKELHLRGYSDIELYLAGSGNIDEVVSDWKEYESNIHLTGQVDDMFALRKEMDVEILCSKAEAFGRVTAEAMSAGIPVIGTNSGGTPELIKDGYNGFLFSTDNYSELANKIELLYKNKDMKLLMGENAYKYANDFFSIERCVSEFESYLTEVYKIYNKNKSDI